MYRIWHDAAAAAAAGLRHRGACTAFAACRRLLSETSMRRQYDAVITGAAVRGDADGQSNVQSLVSGLGQRTCSDSTRLRLLSSRPPTTTCRRGPCSPAYGGAYART